MSGVLSWLGSFDWTALLGVVLGFLGEQFRARLAEGRIEQDRKDLGRAEAQREGAEAVSKIAGEQAERAASPLNDEGILDRLRRGTGGLVVAILAAGLLAGCQHTRAGPATAADIRAACGQVRVWPRDYQRRLAEELAKLPADHPLWQLARDAIAARDAIRICRQEGQH